MNLNFCRHHCGKSWHPRKIMITSEGEWYLCMGDAFNDECRYVRIEPIPKFMKNPPKGWYKCGSDELLFEEGNAEDDMWSVKLASGESSCPFVAEHTLYDIQHEKRMDDWRDKEAKRLVLIEDRMKKQEEKLCQG